MLNRKIRNGEIDILRFIFALTVILSHIPYEFMLNFSCGKIGQYGWFGVEFFFLVSGILLAEHYYKNENEINQKIVYKEVWNYTIKKISYIYLYFIIIKFIYFIMLVFHTKNIKIMIITILESIPLLLFINKPVYMEEGLFVAPDWYLSGLFISTFIIYAIILYKKRKYTMIIAPILSVFILGYLLYKYGKIDVSIDKNIVSPPCLRAFAEMSFGVFCYEIVVYIKKFNFNKCIFLLCKYISILISILFAIGYFNRRYTFSIFLICALGITLSFSEIGFCIKGNKFTEHLAKLSMLMYMIHYIIIRVFNHYKLFNNSEYTLMLIVFTIISSELLFLVVDKFILKIVNKYISKIVIK